MDTYTFKAEIQQLLNILVHSLYTEQEIFVRELVSNATDAIHRLQYEMLTSRDVLDPDAELAIHIDVDQEAKTLTISDTGIGMTREEMVQNLGTIAQSGAAAFIKQLEEMEDQERPKLEMIGQFGVGFYSTFMVADTVRVVSRSFRPDASAWAWTSDGKSEFQIEPADKTDRGTEITVHLKEDASEFSSDWKMEQIVKRHSDFVPFPIYVGEKIANRQKPLWRQTIQETEQEEYHEFYKQLTFDQEPPLLYVHMVTDIPVDIRSVLYVPSKADRGPLAARPDYGLRLYAKGVLIQEHNKELLPTYLRFVEGVIESEDLPLNVSRETVQQNPAARRIQKALIGKLVRELESIAENDPEQYHQFWDEYGMFVKEGVATDFAGRDALLPLLRFHTSHRGDTEGTELASLAQYVERMPEEQDAIYYLMGQDLESIVHSPHLDYFQAREIEVLYLVDPIDGFLTATLTEYEGKPLKNIDDASLDLAPEEEQPSSPEQETPYPEFAGLVARIKNVLGERVSDVRESKILSDSPCRLVSPDRMPGQDMQRVYRLLNQELQETPRILEVNRNHPLIRDLSNVLDAQPDAPLIDLTITQLYENQLLVEGLHPNPATIVSRIQDLMTIAAGAVNKNTGPGTKQE